MGGVRVQPEQLQEVRYALNALLEESKKRRPAAEVGHTGRASLQCNSVAENPQAEYDVQELSSRLEEFLSERPNRSAVWHDWAGAHGLLAEEGLVTTDARGMEAAQEALDDLDRNG